MHRTVHRRRARLAAMALIVGVLTGCASGAGGDSADPSDSSGPDGSRTATSSSPSSSSSGPTDSEATRRATTLAAGYAYDRALKVLRDVDSAKARELTREIKAEQADLVAWPKGDPVPHLFFHSLIVEPDLAFDGDDRAQGYDDYMATIPEFTAILASLLEQGYVLVDPHDIAAVGDDGQMRYQTIKLPEGKKPLVLSVDDVSYYEYMHGDGFADRLILEEDTGTVRTLYTDPQGKARVGAHDVVPILDDFVTKHPQFSYRGAKGVIALTGYDGVLGYRTSPDPHADDPDLAQQRTKATEVADAMKENGWTFASHTWGHINMTTASLGKITADTQRWKKEVQPIVGETNMLIYPFGANISGVAEYSGPKYRYLENEGYNYFFGVDGTGPWQQTHQGYLRQARMNIDGIMLRRAVNGETDVLEPFFDPTKVIDDARKGIE